MVDGVFVFVFVYVFVFGFVKVLSVSFIRLSQGASAGHCMILEMRQRSSVWSVAVAVKG